MIEKKSFAKNEIEGWKELRERKGGRERDLQEILSLWGEYWLILHLFFQIDRSVSVLNATLSLHIFLLHAWKIFPLCRIYFYAKPFPSSLFFFISRRPCTYASNIQLYAHTNACEHARVHIFTRSHACSLSLHTVFWWIKW